MCESAKHLSLVLMAVAVLLECSCSTPNEGKPDPLVTAPSDGGEIGLPATPLPDSQVVEVDDLLEITFFTEVGQSTGDYRFQPGDGIQVIFSYQTPEVENLLVRPDGKISLPVIGDVVAAGTTPNQLAERLTRIFSLPPSKVSVIALTTNSQVNLFLATLAKNENRSGTRATVRANGTITLPLLGTFHVAGMTVESFRKYLQDSYAKLFPALNVSVEIISSPYRRYAVLGEVFRPGVFQVQSNSVSQMEALANAGGLKDTAKYDHLVLFKYSPTGWRVYRINLTEQIKAPASFKVYYLGPQDVLYVPKSSVANVDLFVNQYMVNTLPFVMSASGTVTHTIP